MVTISDVAAKVGVSRATVSYVLNDRNTRVRISDHTRARVLATAAELGYRRNELARAVITGKNRMLGFWVMQTHQEPVVRVLSGAMKEADENEHFIKMLGIDNNVVDARVVERCIEWRLSGIIAIHAPEAAIENLYPQIVQSQIPLVIVDSQRPPANSVHIMSDGAWGIRAVVEHLIALGHRNIAFIGGDADDCDSISRIRKAAYVSTLQSQGLARFIRVQHGRWDSIHMEAAARALLTCTTMERPSAICCVSDHTAMVLIRTAIQMGLRVPQDLSVTGFDDLAAAALYNPPLTTVAQPFEEMGRLAVRRLLTLNGRLDDDPEREDVLPTRLVVRGSSAPAP